MTEYMSKQLTECLFDNSICFDKQLSSAYCKAILISALWMLDEQALS